MDARAQAQCSRRWTERFTQVEAALDEDPESPQALAARWKKLVEGFTGGHYAIGAGVNQLYADRPNWPEAAKERMAPFRNPKMWQFMGRVMQHAGK